MCRFLIIKSKNKISPDKFLKEFALMCEKSLAPDGERQKDGYGIAWTENGKWKLTKSLVPIWEDMDNLNSIPETNLLVAHARGAAFDKIGIEFNQPFLEDNLCFVFNGMIRKIKLKMDLTGVIGSQKLFSLIKMVLSQKKDLKKTLEEIKQLISNNSKKVEGMNIGLIRANEIAVLCLYSQNKDYFTLNYYQADDLILISSQPLKNFPPQTMPNGEIRSF